MRSWRAIQAEPGQPWPAARTNAAAWCTADGTLRLFGGDGAEVEHHRTTLGDEWRFDPVRREWTEVTYAGDGPSPRSSVLVWPAADGAWLFGGSPQQPGVMHDLWIRERSGWTNRTQEWFAERPGPRSGAVTWTGPNGDLYLFAGIGRTPAGGLAFVDDVWRYAPDDLRWRRVPRGERLAERRAPERYAAARCQADHAVIIFGGLAETATGSLRGDLWAIDVVTGAMTELHPGLGAPDSVAPSPRCAAAVFAEGDEQVFVFGGFDRDRAMTNDLWAFDLRSRRWECVFPGTDDGDGSDGEVPSPRYGAATWVDRNRTWWRFGGIGLPNEDAEVTVLGDLWRWGD